jgi:hypothetical protein
MLISYVDNICFLFEYGMLRQFAVARVARSPLVFVTTAVMAISYFVFFDVSKVAKLIFE